MICAASRRSSLRYCLAAGLTPPEPAAIADAFLIDYAGASGDYEAVSLADVLDGGIDPAVFKDCVVWIGACATGLQDDFFVSTNRGAPLYGVEIHANILQNLMEGPLGAAARSYRAPGPCFFPRIGGKGVVILRRPVAIDLPLPPFLSGYEAAGRFPLFKPRRNVD